MFTTLSTIQDFLNPYADREVREKEGLSILIFSARLGFQAGSMNSSVNVDTSPRILHLESGIRGWKKSASRKPGSNLGKKNVCALESNGYVMKFLMEL